MTFKDVVVKNFKGSLRNYLAYFLSSTFCIVIFFMYATLIFNKGIHDSEYADVLQYIIPITIITIIAFSIFFVNYAHNAFLKGRNKEFGVYMTLGMSQKEIQKLVSIETLAINCTSILTGMLFGALFSRLFQMMIVQILQLEQIEFYLDYKAFACTTVVFAVIFVSLYLNTIVRMRKMDIAQLLKEARTSHQKNYKKSDLVFGEIGVVMLVTSVVFLIILTKHEEWIAKPLPLIAYIGYLFIGVYLLLAKGGNYIIYRIRRSRHYYNHLLTVQEIHSKYNQNKKIMFVVSLLIATTIAFTASPYSLSNLSESIAEDNEHDISFIQTETINSGFDGDKKAEVFSQMGITEKKEVPFIYVPQYPDATQRNQDVVVVSQQTYYEMTGEQIVLEEGSCYFRYLGWQMGGDLLKQKEITLYGVQKSNTLKISNDSSKEYMSTAFLSTSMIVVTNSYYEELKEESRPENQGNYTMIDVEDWKESQAIVNSVKQYIEVPGTMDSILEVYQNLKKSYNVFLFVGSVLGVLFFIAAGSVLYFKQFTELEDSKRLYQKLYKIGITKKEMEQVVGNEMRMIFFVPVIIGVFIGLSFIYLMTYIQGAGVIVNEFMKNSIMISILFLISQVIFYLITKKKYMYEILKK